MNGINSEEKFKNNTMAEKEKQPNGHSINRKFLPYGLAAIFALSLASTAFASCSPSNEEKEIAVMQEQGILGKHPVVDLRTIPGFSSQGNISGGFLVFSGQYEGKTATLLQFAWKISDEDKNIQISEIPIDKVKFFVSDDSKTKPSVEFNIDIGAMIRSSGYIVRADWYPAKQVNLNNYVNHSQQVIITLSQNDFNSFREIK